MKHETTGNLKHGNVRSVGTKSHGLCSLAARERAYIEATAFRRRVCGIWQVWSPEPFGAAPGHLLSLALEVEAMIRDPLLDGAQKRRTSFWMPLQYIQTASASLKETTVLYTQTKALFWIYSRNFWHSSRSCDLEFEYTVFPHLLNTPLLNITTYWIPKSSTDLVPCQNNQI